MFTLSGSSWNHLCPLCHTYHTSCCGCRDLFYAGFTQLQAGASWQHPSRVCPVHAFGCLTCSFSFTRICDIHRNPLALTSVDLDVCVCVCVCVCMWLCVLVGGVLWPVNKCLPFFLDRHILRYISCGFSFGPFNCSSIFSPIVAEANSIVYSCILPYSLFNFLIPHSWHQTQVSCIAGRFFIVWATKEAHIPDTSVKLLLHIILCLWLFSSGGTQVKTAYIKNK